VSVPARIPVRQAGSEPGAASGDELATGQDHGDVPGAGRDDR
jgi:hypothetical protein